MDMLNKTQKIISIHTLSHDSNIMEIIHEQGDDAVAKAYLARFGDDDCYVEFVDSLGGATSRKDKWVIIVSSMFGCPINCKFCDAGHFYEGKLTTDEIMQQIDYVVRKNYPSGKIDTKKFKVQFARIGEPSLNDAVLDAILQVRERYSPKHYMPCISTIAPSGRETWFRRLKELNHEHFSGNFQLQFSIHSTDEDRRDFLMPVDKWSLERISDYGGEFYIGGRKVTLNFALHPDNIIDVNKLRRTFSPNTFAIKITPLNPTSMAEKNRLINVFSDEDALRYPIIEEMRKAGFQVHLSIGDLRENEIKSNCGQVLQQYLDSMQK